MTFNLKSVFAVALGAAAFNVAAQQSAPATDQSGPVLTAPSVSLRAPPRMTEESLAQIGRDPANLGRMMAVYIGTMPALMGMCGWNEARAEPLALKSRRVIELFFGGMPLEMQIPFAEGYFTMEEKFVAGLNESTDEELGAVCARISRDEKEMSGVLDQFLEPLEKAVLRGELTPMNPYEGRGVVTLKSTGDLAEKGGDLE